MPSASGAGGFFRGFDFLQWGALLLREVDRRLGLTAQVARRLGDSRQRGKVRHEVVTMLRQRVHGLALGYEDLNDHDTVRGDPMVQTACGRDQPLASSSTLCRFERRAERQWAIAIHRSWCSTSTRPMLRCTAVSPEVSSTGTMTTCRCTCSAASSAWPGVRIVFRGDSGFCRHRMFDWCERHGVGYLVGLARNPQLEREAAVACEVARDGFEATGRKSQLFTEFEYAARSWSRPRRVIARIEHGPKGRNPRFIVTNLNAEADALYDRVYCQRGDMENRIKEQQLDLFADRTSSTKWWANQYRLLLAGLAYLLLETMRRTALRGTALARSQCRSLRLRLLRIGAVMTRNTRTVAGRLSGACPDQDLFRLLVQRLTAG